MRDRSVRVLFSTNYYDRNQVQQVAARTGATAVIVPSTTTSGPAVDTYFKLVSLWVAELERAYTAAAAAGTGR
jgi:ABC-type Zn uptake system ZnuABC Zn-binding protein ZnuA